MSRLVNLHRDGAWPGTKVDVESEVSTRLRNQTRIPTRTIHERGPVTDERISTELGDGIMERKKSVKSELWIFSFLCFLLFSKAGWLRSCGDVSFFFFFLNQGSDRNAKYAWAGRSCFKEEQCVTNEGIFEGMVRKFCAPERKYSESCCQRTSFAIAIVQKTSVVFAPALFHKVLYI